MDTEFGRGWEGGGVHLLKKTNANKKKEKKKALLELLTAVSEYLTTYSEGGPPGSATALMVQLSQLLDCNAKEE